MSLFFGGGFGGGASRLVWSGGEKELGAVGGTAGSVPRRKGSLKQGRAFAVPSVAGGRRHAQRPALCKWSQAVLSLILVACSPDLLAARQVGVLDHMCLLQVML